MRSDCVLIVVEELLAITVRLYYTEVAMNLHPCKAFAVKVVERRQMVLRRVSR